MKSLLIFEAWHEAYVREVIINFRRWKLILVGRTSHEILDLLLTGEIIIQTLMIGTIILHRGPAQNSEERLSSQFHQALRGRE
jgi:hypothetical protein